MNNKFSWNYKKWNLFYKCWFKFQIYKHTYFQCLINGNFDIVALLPILNLVIWNGTKMEQSW